MKFKKRRVVAWTFDNKMTHCWHVDDHSPITATFVIARRAGYLLLQWPFSQPASSWFPSTMNFSSWLTRTLALSRLGAFNGWTCSWSPLLSIMASSLVLIIVSHAKGCYFGILVYPIYWLTMISRRPEHSTRKIYGELVTTMLLNSKKHDRRVVLTFLILANQLLHTCQWASTMSKTRLDT